MEDLEIRNLGDELKCPPIIAYVFSIVIYPFVIPVFLMRQYSSYLDGHKTCDFFATVAPRHII
jgi:hypothetical protein